MEDSQSCACFRQEFLGDSRVQSFDTLKIYNNKDMLMEKHICNNKDMLGHIQPGHVFISFFADLLIGNCLQK